MRNQLGRNIIEQEGQRVLTTAQLAESYGTNTRRISENFNANKGRYTEGKHFFLLEGDDLKAFKSENKHLNISLNTSKIYLWTFDGCILHANHLRSVSTDIIYELAENFEVNTSDLIIVGDCSKEFEFQKLLESILPIGCNLRTQALCQSYRLDFYIPELSLVIEFDEKAHKYRNEEDLKRERDIKRVMPDCTIIRVDENDIYAGLKEITSFFYKTLTVKEKSNELTSHYA